MIIDTEERVKEINNESIMNYIRKYFFIFCSLLFIVCSLSLTIPAFATSLIHVSDTISDSAPNSFVNHTIKFTVTTAIPPSGKIVITPEEEHFTIPSEMDYTDIDLAVDGSDRDLAEDQDSNNDGIAVVSGNSGNISITLNTTAGVAVSSQVTIKIGTHATYQTAGDQQIKNPSSAGSYKINIKTYDASLNLLDRADAMVAIIEGVTVGASKEVPEEEIPEEEVVVSGGGPIAPPPPEEEISPVEEVVEEEVEEVVEEVVPEVVFEKPIAEMTLAEIKAKITEILEVIAILKIQLKRALAEEAAKIIPSDYGFTKNLFYGQKNDDVRYLQAFLKAQGTEIYPEGLVTGYFGPLTKAAVIRFQEKYTKDILSPWRLTKGTGFVGTTTRARINELLGR